MSTARHGSSVAGPGRPTSQRRPIVARRLLFTRLHFGIQNGVFVGWGGTGHQQHETEMFRIHETEMFRKQRNFYRFDFN